MRHHEAIPYLDEFSNEQEAPVEAPNALLDDPDELTAEEEFVEEHPAATVTDLDSKRREKKQDIRKNEGVVTLDALQLLLREAGRYPLLKPEQEIRLAKRIERGDLAAKEKMINSNLRLVVANARRYQGQGLELNDLIQEGMLGLVRAVEKFDWRKGFRFSTYGTLWIRQAIQRGLENTSRTIRLPVHVAQRSRKVGRVERELTVKLGYDPTDEEIAEEASLPIEDVIETRKADRSIVSLDKPVGDEEDTAFGELLDNGKPRTDDEAIIKLNRQTLLESIEDLPSQDREVIEMRFGIDGNEPLTLAQVGKRLGVSTERARQIEDRALTRLRRAPKIIAMHEVDR